VKFLHQRGGGKARDYHSDIKTLISWGIGSSLGLSIPECRGASPCLWNLDFRQDERGPFPQAAHESWIRIRQVFHCWGRRVTRRSTGTPEKLRPRVPHGLCSPETLQTLPARV